MAARVLVAIKDFEAQGLRIFVEVREADVLAQARASDVRHKEGRARGVFDGVLVAVKVRPDALAVLSLMFTDDVPTDAFDVLVVMLMHIVSHSSCWHVCLSLCSLTNVLFLLSWFQDMIPIKGHSMCNGKHPTTCKTQTQDDPIVQRFRDAGAIILGK